MKEKEAKLGFKRGAILGDFGCEWGSAGGAVQGRRCSGGCWRRRRRSGVGVVAGGDRNRGRGRASVARCWGVIGGDGGSG